MGQQQEAKGPKASHLKLESEREHEGRRSAVQAFDQGFRLLPNLSKPKPLQLNRNSGAIYSPTSQVPATWAKELSAPQSIAAVLMFRIAAVASFAPKSGDKKA